MLNLTQDHQQLNHGRQQQQVSMHHGMQQQQQQQYPSFMHSSNLEVGLNLSLQKSYASQQQSQQQQQQQQQNGFYAQYDVASDYTFAVPMGNSSNQVNFSQLNQHS